MNGYASFLISPRAFCRVGTFNDRGGDKFLLGCMFNLKPKEKLRRAKKKAKGRLTSGMTTGNGFIAGS